MTSTGTVPERSARVKKHRAAARSRLASIPDFSAVAADYDAVHLSVVGYLTTAGRALSVNDGRTVLAGWDPDKTFWLTEVLAASGPATGWRELDDGPLGWTLCGASA